jgi:hypothetical protein
MLLVEAVLLNALTSRLGSSSQGSRTVFVYAKGIIGVPGERRAWVLVA